METKDIIARAIKAREYEYTCNGSRTYKLRLPSEHETRVAYLTYIKDEGEDGRVAGWALAQRKMLEQSLIGWDGITAQDILPDAPAPLPLGFVPAMVPVLLDVLDDDACELMNDMATRLKERNAKLEESVKK